MKIFEENGNIRLQLMDTKNMVMLFDFTVEKEAFPILKEHIIKHLEEFEHE